jgi:hypothetical protein
MKTNDNSIKNLILGGIIGTALGSILAENKTEGALLGAIIGTASSATIEANKIANQTKITQMIEVDGKLIKINPDGTRNFIRNIRKVKRDYPQQIILP